MLLTDRPSSFHLPVTELADAFSNHNQQTYLRLKLALGLGFRRQIFLAVCDDVGLRNQLAQSLTADLDDTGLAWQGDRWQDPPLSSSTTPAQTSIPLPVQPPVPPQLEPWQILSDRNPADLLSNPNLPAFASEASGRFPDLLRSQSLLSLGSVRLVSLSLQVGQLDLQAQIRQWLTHRAHALRTKYVTFQVLGIEKLTRQPVNVQHAFLHHLRLLGRQSQQDWNLLLWVSRPWYRVIQQSAPELWRNHTAVFEFEGEPVPTKHLAQSSAPSTTTHKPSSHPRLEDPIVTAAHPTPSESVANLDPAAPLNATDWFSPTERELVDSVMASVIQSLGMGREGTPSNQTAINLADPNYIPLHLLQQVELLHQQQADPSHIALIYRQLGDWYRDRTEQNPTPPTFKIGLQAYEQALLHLSPQAEQVSDILNEMGNLYLMLARNAAIADSVPYLEQAIAAYEEALLRVNAQESPFAFAMIQSNLGTAYSDLAQRQQSEDHWYNATIAYQAALQYRSIEEDADRYGATQNNLGTAYWNLAQYRQPLENLQQAILAYQAALTCHDPTQDPLPYAMIQNNIGTAYWNLSQCQGAPEWLKTSSQDLLKSAIAAYRVALDYRTFEAAPAGYAATQNNLGTAYWHLAHDPGIAPTAQLDYLNRAIEVYETCLQAAQTMKQQGMPILNFDPAVTHHNLADAYRQSACQPHAPLPAEKRRQALDRALQHHLQAWQAWQTQPDYAAVALDGMVAVIRAYHEYEGVAGQSQAMSKLPAILLPTVMKQL
ncbi:MAG: tetratricopeptide repeat protein [Synechococcales bacterium]|nr:tetratricopeptide repeat protein [Synechococcales bacterium]